MRLAFKRQAVAKSEDAIGNLEKIVRKFPDEIEMEFGQLEYERESSLKLGAKRVDGKMMENIEECGYKHLGT